MNRDAAIELLNGGEKGIEEWNRHREAVAEIPEQRDAYLREAYPATQYGVFGTTPRRGGISSHLHPSEFDQQGKNGHADTDNGHPWWQVGYRLR